MILTCVDAFSGAGGMGLGLQRAGFSLLLSFDLEALCVKTHKLNKQYFTHPAYVADIREMLNGRLLTLTQLQRGELTLLAGGPPCQGFSIQRIGSDQDERNDLVNLYVQLVEETFPRFFLMENVPGISGKRGNVMFNAALQQAAKAGYWIHKAVLDAQDYEVPQRRRRVIVVGERMDSVFPSFEFPQTSTTAENRHTVRQTIGSLPPPPEDGSDHPEFPHHRRDRLSAKNLLRIAALQPGQGRDYLPDELLADCHRVSSDIIGHRNVYGRMEWDAPAPTITAKFDSFTRGQFGHPDQHRSISLREGALLQTFPIDFNFAGSKVDIARQIGNAVPPRLAEQIGRQIALCCLSIENGR